jgi:hypothetical protein
MSEVGARFGRVGLLEVSTSFFADTLICNSLELEDEGDE